MAKTKPRDKKSKKSKKQEKAVLHRTNGMSSKAPPPPTSPQELLAKSKIFLQEADLENALDCAQRALGAFDIKSKEALPAVILLGQILVERGEIEQAREYFQLAAITDEEGALGAEKFLWLAQLSEDGGQDSVDWYMKGALSLQSQIQGLVDQKKLSAADQELLEEKRGQLATALCSVVEVYMTDLSWEEDAEQKCESLVTQATMVAPGFSEPWQTLANVRISQQREEDARAALKRSLEIWKDLPPNHPLVPDHPTRVSLSRLLLEVAMDQEAIDVLDTLTDENEESVEAWYLGGWGLFIIGEKLKNGEVKGEEGETWETSWQASRDWLEKCLALFKQQDYQDERLGEHAKKLLDSINAVVGEDEGEDEGNEPEEDEEMTGA